MKLLKHKHILELYEYFFVEGKLYIVMEYASEGDMDFYLDEYTNGTQMLEEEHARRLFRQIGSAVQYLHRKGIVHGDLKLEHLLLDSENDIKLCDFGHSTLFSSKSKREEGDFISAIMAPEVLSGKVFGPEADVWSLGIILQKLISNSEPYIGDSCTEVLERIDKGYTPPAVSDNCKDLLSLIFQKDPKKRITLEAFMKHKWIIKEDGEIKPHTSQSGKRESSPGGATSSHKANEAKCIP